MDNNQNKNKNGAVNKIAIAITILLAIFILAMCSSGGSSKSGRKWSDLSDQEKENARWAYYAQQAANGK